MRLTKKCEFSRTSHRVYASRDRINSEAIMGTSTSLRFAVGLLTIATALVPGHAQDAGRDAPLRLAIAGLVHGHVSGFLRAAQTRNDVQIVGVFDPDPTLRRTYAERYSLPAGVLFDNLDAMLDRAHPEAVASFTSTADHPGVVEAAAARHVHVMMEKPLAVSNADARRIRLAAEKGAIQVLVNYETTWYPNHGAIWTLFKERGAAGEIRKMVALDGHQGPKKINVQPEFLDWLSDPVRNGGGALFDFGCYGANLMTWLMGNQRPVAVTAVTQQFQPEIYPRVDDEATILLEYPKAQGIIQASWNWPFNRKDLEVYGDHGMAIATTGGGALRVALPNEPDHLVTPEPRPPDERSSISHLLAVVRGQRKPNGLSSLDNNLIVTEILEAARESARTHQRVILPAERPR
jgi:predicted dehydrogenase